MIPTPPQFDAEHARRWQDADAAENYRYRMPYPPETFDVLLSLIRDEPRAVLDVGCGTGNIARLLAPRVSRVDAVDLSAEMVSAGRRAPGGDDARINWQVAPAEDADLRPPYALIVGGASLHWMKWEVVMPRFARSLTPNGVLAVANPREAATPPWAAKIDTIVARHSTYRQYIPFDMIAAWEGAGLFRQEGERRTAPFPFEQPLEEFILGWHATSNLTRAHIDADAFDAEVRRAMGPHIPDGVVRREVVGHVVWGKAMDGAGGAA